MIMEQEGEVEFMKQRIASLEQSLAEMESQWSEAQVASEMTPEDDLANLGLAFNANPDDLDYMAKQMAQLQVRLANTVQFRLPNSPGVSRKMEAVFC